MSDSEEGRSRILVFVSNEGRVVGVGQELAGRMVGVCLAYLAEVVELPAWAALLSQHDDPEVAADVAVEHFGGFRMRHVVFLENPTVFPPLAGGPVGEA